MFSGNPEKEVNGSDLTLFQVVLILSWNSQEDLCVED